jgi:hypothetical protein
MSEALREAIRAKFRTGTLRGDAAARAWYGQGQDRPCVACDRRIATTDREVEADFADGVTLRFHRECFHVWDDERSLTADERSADETSAITAAVLPEALCVPCIVEKTGIPSARVRAFFARIRPTVELTEASAPCGECGLVTRIYRIG